ncbi:MAG: hypothetical protein AMJ63_12195 [Myxococcales bacterium SG8_38_1]|nr:MAG: hypothetical protein AMJ63_12195 [Myxococcales bacterium SG8_38_1]
MTASAGSAAAILMGTPSPGASPALNAPWVADRTTGGHSSIWRLAAPVTAVTSSRMRWARSSPSAARVRRTSTPRVKSCGNVSRRNSIG